MRRLYEKGKIPVVLVHGLWGYPHQWDRMVEYLEAEPDLRERYQFWLFGYESGDSIPFSAHQLRQSLRLARLRFDPKGTDEAFDNLVVVGHSLGGILAKMMGHSSGLRLWQTVSDLPIDNIAGPQKDCLLLRKVYCYERVPEVRRIVFIATPHRGSPFASGLVRDLASRLCDRASSFREARATILARNDAESFVSAFRGENPTSVGELAEGHPLLAALCDLGIDPSVRSNSIIADLRDSPNAAATDGIVPYSSSHLEGAGSELILHGSHICLSNLAMFQERGAFSGNTPESTLRLGPIAEALREMVWSALQRNNPAPRILTSRYGIGGTPERTLAKIGLKLGISKERARQIETHAHSKLRNFARAEGLKTFGI